MNDSVSGCLPYFTSGMVIKGFGRGSKELGIPTANFPEDVVDRLPNEFKCGVYYGLAQIGNSRDVYKMVMSIGWNPFYQNEKKSMETHILHHFDTDFYGEVMKIAILGYIRPERSFSNKEELIDAIYEDIANARSALDFPKHAVVAEHAFFESSATLMHNGKL